MLRTKDWREKDIVNATEDMITINRIMLDVIAADLLREKYHLWLGLIEGYGREEV